MKVPVLGDILKGGDDEMNKEIVLTGNLGKIADIASEALMSIRVPP